jgi:hypothetical protein
MTKQTKKDIPIRTIDELNERYLNFCLNNDLDPSIKASEQYDISERQQLWLDTHLRQRNQAEASKIPAESVSNEETSEQTVAAETDVALALQQEDKSVSRDPLDINADFDEANAAMANVEVSLDALVVETDNHFPEKEKPLRAIRYSGEAQLSFAL